MWEQPPGIPWQQIVVELVSENTAQEIALVVNVYAERGWKRIIGVVELGLASTAVALQYRSGPWRFQPTEEATGWGAVPPWTARLPFPTVKARVCSNSDSAVRLGFP
jgi:hypothetical protein